MTFEGDRADVHPNLNQFIKEYLDAENAKIKAYNLQVQRECAEDLAKHETPV